MKFNLWVSIIIFIILFSCRKESRVSCQIGEGVFNRKHCALAELWLDVGEKGGVILLILPHSRNVLAGSERYN